MKQGKKELKPCPFCGSEATVVGPREIGTSDNFEASIECPQCEFHISFISGIKNNALTEAIKKWNLRSQPVRHSFVTATIGTLERSYQDGWNDAVDAMLTANDSVAGPADSPTKADPRKLRLQGIVLALTRHACVPPVAPALMHQLARLIDFYFENGDEDFAWKLVLLQRGVLSRGQRSVLAPSAHEGQNHNR